MVACPICEKPVKESDINRHIDSECRDYIDQPAALPSSTQSKLATSKPTAAFFTPAPKRNVGFRDDGANIASSPSVNGSTNTQTAATQQPSSPANGVKRSAEQLQEEGGGGATSEDERPKQPVAKKAKNSHAPLAERMRPRTLDEVAGQDLVGADGVLRNLILTDRVPSMILWGGPGTGKTTIARLIAQTAGTRFVEINSTSSGVAECKKLFAEARNELGLTGRKTIIFCDEIHRFSKSQQDVFLGPVEAGQVTLIGATTENPSFKVVNALLSRCRTFTLAKLNDEDVFGILRRALLREQPNHHLLVEDDYALLRYLAAFADGDARTGLNLLELALDLCAKSSTTTSEDIKKSLTQTLVYDRAGDQHYDTISAFHKSVRGSNPDAALYYLARMLQSGEDPLYVARRMVVIASEDVGLADNSMLPLATATYSAAEKIGMPECRINLAHCTVALCLAPKSTRAYRGLNAAYAALREPGIAGLPVPYHLRNAPTKLMTEIGYGKDYKYNPDYLNGRVVQEYLPEKLEGRKFLGLKDLGDKVDPEIAELDEELRLAEQCDPAAEDVLLNPDGD
ncbi:DNA polymerase III, clamp loader complex, gamma/delta/delta subunit [Neohortaea acidophila]|uniref:DNA polymerase III, clamp loader complex, gamma/delta/delta subunit n=1 Tax=Neohortaea acidophila TaxID=245834 RepID=A0A6A6PLK4_9PEZI|nr:DNA polymerase III, clamp loader complex, gamma/delta/delta subunit [Neohortaea acidophila]KAF2480696.1 DNA polymerase III, clamp loader complex, gamma/delta/delta subunit [Neohortaea acidophila]